MFFVKPTQGARAKQEIAEGGEKVFTASDKNKSMKHRLKKDIAGLDLPPEVVLEFGTKLNGEEDQQNFTVTIHPTKDSYWSGGKYPFKFEISENYPYDPPQVLCTTKIWHPNIDLDGNVCLNILRKDWKPVLSINHVIFGLETLFLSPNPTDPLNKGKFRFFRF